MINRSVEVIDRSVVVRRRVRGLRKGSERGWGIRGGCSRNRGLRFGGRLRVGFPYRSVFASITSGNRTKT